MRPNQNTKIKKLKGPILVIGAAGFIGYNFLLNLSKVRNDVYGLVRRKNSWRLKNFDQKDKILVCDIRNYNKTKKIFRKIKPQTIFNCSAYGAYPYQKDVKKIYEINFLSTVNILEILLKQKFNVYLHCGSSSEYGLNCTAPCESDKLLPNSHYAVSKAAVSNLISFYGKKMKKPVIHLRLYSVYGPWEEPKRLIPNIIKKGLNKKLPKLVDENISRDFIYIDDVFNAFIHIAANIKPKHWGEIYNIGTGVKTSISKLVDIVKEIYHIQEPAKFGSMKNRNWDLSNWYANVKKIKKEFGWKYKINLNNGLRLTTSFYKNNNRKIS